MHTPDPHRSSTVPPRPGGRPSRRAAVLAVAATAAALGLVAGVQSGAGAAVQGSLPAGTQFYRDATSQVVKWVAANPGDSRTPVISKRVASQPQGIWFSNYRPNTVTSDVRAVTAAAEQAGQTPYAADSPFPQPR